MHSRVLSIHLTRRENLADSGHECLRPSRVSDARGEHAARRMIARGRLPVPGSAGSGRLPKVGHSQSRVGSRLAPSPPASPATSAEVKQEQQRARTEESRTLVASPPTTPRPRGPSVLSSSCSVMITRHDGTVVCDGKVVDLTNPMMKGPRHSSAVAVEAIHNTEITDACVAVLSACQ